jgi:hypothetical protein
MRTSIILFIFFLGLLFSDKCSGQINTVRFGIANSVTDTTRIISYYIEQDSIFKNLFIDSMRTCVNNYEEWMMKYIPNYGARNTREEYVIEFNLSIEYTTYLIVDSLKETIRREAGASTIVLFFVKEEGISYTYQYVIEDGFEFSVIYLIDTGCDAETAVAHEIMHLFGADHLEGIDVSLFNQPEYLMDIMRECSNLPNCTISPYTARRIGLKP